MRRRYAALSAHVCATALLITSATAFAQDEEEMTFEPDAVDKKKKSSEPPPPDTTPASRTLERATRLYEGDKDSGKGADYASASIEFGKVITGETDDSPANIQRAEFFMGKTLYGMGFYAAALAYFDRIVQKGAGHRYYGATLKWLAALSRVLPETSGLLEKIGSYDVSDLDQPVMAEVRDELYYLLGRHYYRQANFDQAIQLFGSIRKENPFFIKGKFFEGVTYVRQYKGKPALESFKDILVIGEEERPDYYSADDVKTYQELSWLQLARVFYSTQQFDTSIKYYEKLDQGSPDWLDSLFEASWAYFMKTKNSKALGNIHTLNAPYFEGQYFPESVLLKAVIYYKYCQYDRALEAVAEYNQTFRPLRDDLEQILKKHEDNAAFYGYIKQVLSGKAGLREEVQRMVASALADKTLGKTLAWVDELDNEIKLLGKSDRAWQTTAVATEVLQELNVQKSLAEADAGALARERISRLSEELRELSRDGTKIRIETLGNMAGEISARAKGEQISGSSRQEPIDVDDEHFMWNFNGEYWKDELGYYRFQIQSKCPKKGA